MQGLAGLWKLASPEFVPPASSSKAQWFLGGAQASPICISSPDAEVVWMASLPTCLSAQGRLKDGHRPIRVKLTSFEELQESFVSS